MSPVHTRGRMHIYNTVEMSTLSSHSSGELSHQWSSRLPQVKEC